MSFDSWWKHHSVEAGLDGWRVKDLVERAWNHGYSQCHRDRAVDAASVEANAAYERAAQVCENEQTGHGKRKGGSDGADAVRRACAVRIRALISVPAQNNVSE